MEYLTIPEVAEKLGVNGETVRHWLKSKQLGGFKAGKQWRIEPRDLSEFIKRNKTEVQSGN